MKVNYATSRLRKELTEEKALKKAFGTNSTNVMRRHQQLLDTANAGELFRLPGKWHTLTPPDKIAANVSPNHRIIIKPDTKPVPLKNDKSIDWDKVTAILVTAANEDYH